MYRDSWLPEVFNDFLNTTNMPKTNATAPAINVLETETDYTVEVAAPGLSKDDFEVNINNEGDVTIKMEKKSDEKEQKAHYLRREFAYSKYEQTLILPDDVEKEHIAARVVNCVLTVTLPKIKVDVQKIARQITVG